ncbi:MAG: hypothetical protein H8E28_06170 [Anaerolineae bacterium]|nr:hypothetical protein [Anaerolineae bacterium]
MWIDLEKKEYRLLLSLLLIDAAFIVAHILKFSTNLVSSYLFSLEQNKGYAEIYQDIKGVWIVALLVYLLIRRRKIFYAIWLLLFGFILLNNVMTFHESIAGSLSTNLMPFDWPLSYKVKLGEMGLYMMIGIPTLIFIGATYRKSAPEEQTVTRALLWLFALLMVFALGVDLLHIGIRRIFDTQLVYEIMGGIEEGGEMVVMSFIYAYLFGLDGRSAKTQKHEITKDYLPGRSV